MCDGTMAAHVKQPRKMSGWKGYGPYLSNLMSQAATWYLQIVTPPTFQSRAHLSRQDLVCGAFSDTRNPRLSRYLEGP
jgi:hypothetical protein